MLIRVTRGVDFTRNKFTDYMPWTPPPPPVTPPFRPRKLKYPLETPPPLKKILWYVTYR